MPSMRLTLITTAVMRAAPITRLASVITKPITILSTTRPTSTAIPVPTTTTEAGVSGCLIGLITLTA